MDGRAQLDVGRGGSGERGDMHGGGASALGEAVDDAQGAGLIDPRRAEGRGWGALKVVCEDGSGHLESANVYLAIDDTVEAIAALIERDSCDLAVIASIDGQAGGDAGVGERGSAVVAQRRVEDFGER